VENLGAFSTSEALLKALAKCFCKEKRKRINKKRNAIKIEKSKKKIVSQNAMKSLLE
jgi:hypothetical protein